MRRHLPSLALCAITALSAVPAHAASWTDYNTHDPGVTTLTALIYSISSWAYAWPWYW